ncbi:MAG: hypothetical protein JWN83_308, partial [Chitinophagaceae bacterium]|nr:hypothetical protein [Chitinophagaceae bacterium]
NTACTATGVALGTPVTADNCSVASVTNDAPSAFPLGTTTVTWTVTDGSGHTATATQTVTVTDNVNPTITCPSATAMLCYNANGYTINPLVATDNCTAANSLGYSYIVKNSVGATISTGTTNNPSGAFSVGLNTIYWTVTDAAQNSSTCTTYVDINKQLLANPIAPQIAVPNYGAPNTIYYGYGPTFLTYMVSVASATPGTPGYSYQWYSYDGTTPLGTNASQKITPPLVTGGGSYTYTVRITDSRSCTTTQSITITVVDIRNTGGSNGNNVMVYICHNGSNITVDSHAIPAFIQQGDKLGQCPPPPNTGGRAGGPTAVTDIKVNVAPNPAVNDFRLYVQSTSNELMTIKITDAFGQIKATITGLQNSQLVTFGGNYRAGTYFAEVIQGNSRKTVKLVKL